MIIKFKSYVYESSKNGSEVAREGGSICFDRGTDTKVTQNINQNLKGATLIIS